MSSTNLTPPRSGVPIGRVMIGGQRVPVEIDPEYLRYFYTLFQRLGGVVGSSTADLEALLDETSALANEAAQAPVDGSSAALAEMVKQLSGFEQSSDRNLHEEVQALRVRIDGLEQQ